MYNWTVDEKILKQHPIQYARWHLEQLINFGLNNEKISKKSLKKNFSYLKIDDKKKKYLSFLLEK